MNDPGPADCACGWPLTDCRADGGEIVPPGYDYSRDSAKPHPGDPCPKLAMEAWKAAMTRTSSEQSPVRERRRILRAAAEGRLRVNDSGRYVIGGEKRPDRKVREQLMYHDPQFVAWPRWDERHCRITVDGRGELRELEAALSGLSSSEAGERG